MKRLVSGLLCVSLAASLVACSEKTSDNEAVETTEATTTTAAETTVETTTEETTAETTDPEETTTETTAAVEIDKNDLLKGYDTFDLSSGDLVDGVWNDVMANSEEGNRSPELSWEAVDGASLYVIYMIDLDAAYFMHWKADGVTETSLPQGWAEKGFIGPYPPEGTTHTYDVYVVALKNPVERVKGMVNAVADNFPNFIQGLDTDADGNSGNIISYGHLSGTYTAK